MQEQRRVARQDEVSSFVVRAEVQRALVDLDSASTFASRRITKRKGVCSLYVDEVSRGGGKTRQELEIYRSFSYSSI